MKLKTHHNVLILAGLIVVLLVSRFLLLFEGVIPFGFDHGKDSLAILEMVSTLSPSLIGPWTSIPGLYFGAGWDYLLAPFYLLGGYHPLSGVVVMVLLLALQVGLAYKYFGFWPAALMVAAPFWFIISISAWNPFPMTLITLLLLIVLKWIFKEKELSLRNGFLLGFIAATGFHFSSAYAIFYPVLILVLLLYKRVRLSLWSVLVTGLGYLLPFTPQILFEFRNQFVQSNAVFGYFRTGETQTRTLARSLETVNTTYSELRLAFMPELRAAPTWINKVLQTGLLVSLGFIFVLKRLWRKPLVKQYLLYFVSFVGIPLVGYQFLHFNVWYVYGMMPVIAVLVGHLISQQPKWLQAIWGLALIGTAISLVTYFHFTNKAELVGARAFLPVKVQALDLIREESGGEPFASYHYVPDIYDFSYQYLYFYQAFQGEQLPVEFAYEPNVQPYITQKENLLSLFPSNQQSPKKIFFIVESAEESEFLTDWWNRQHYGEIIKTIPLSKEVTIFVATPKQGE